MIRSPWLATLLAVSLAAQDRPAITVRVDPRVELLSIVFRLAGNPEYSQGRLPAYNAAVDAHFAEHKDHAVVLQARRLRAACGVSYDAVASFAVHLDGIDPPKFATGLQRRPERLEQRWTLADAKTFLKNLADFVDDAKVAKFLAGQRDLYAHAEAQMQKVVAEHADLTWFQTFFGERPKARFQVVLGLLNGGGNYGPSAKLADGSEDLYAILGCWDKDEQGLPRYGKTIVPTLVHEYCHSYCNPVVDEHLKALAPAGNALFALTEAAMREQAYANGRTLLCESLVRACTVRYRATIDGDQAAADEIREQYQRSFFWTADLAQLLADEYEGRRQDHPTLHEFGEPLARFFAAQVPKIEARAQKAPRVVSMAPANGQQDVDPGLTALVITFDRPMRDGGWAVVGGGEHFPELTGKPSYDQECKVLTVPCKLKPSWRYELWLNRGRFDTFRAADGTPLASVHVTFTTRAP